MSDPAQTVWHATSPWVGIADPGRAGNKDGSAGVRIETIAHAGLAMIVVRRGFEADLRRSFHELLSCDVPTPGTAVFGPDIDLVCSAPGQWLAMSLQDNMFLDLPGRLSGIAAVTDQSDSRGLLEIGGPSARDMLQKGFAIDLHPSAFQAGSAAATKAAHIAVQIWQMSDVPLYKLAVPRSFVGSFWSWLTSACAECGYEVADAGCYVSSSLVRDDTRSLPNR